MKLVFCNNCADVFSLQLELRQCKCGQSSGKYVDQKNAVIFGHAMPFGVSNQQLGQALERRDTIQQGGRVECWVPDWPCSDIDEQTVEAGQYIKTEFEKSL